MKSTLVSCGVAFALALAGAACAQAGAGGAGSRAATAAEANASSTFDELLQAELGAAGGLTANEVAARALQASPVLRVRSEELLAARLTYYGWVRARLNVIVAEQALLQARAHLADVQAQRVAGGASKADLLRVESQVAQSELLVVSSQNLSALNEKQLRTALHDTGGRSYRIGEDMRQPLSASTLAPLSGLWAEALSQRAALKALAVSRSACAGALDAQYTELVDQIRIQVLSAKQSLEQALVSETTSVRGLAAAEESYRARRLLFQNRRATTVELLDAETDLTRARLGALGARVDTRVASVRLAYALGRTDMGTARTPAATPRTPPGSLRGKLYLAAVEPR